MENIDSNSGGYDINALGVTPEDLNSPETLDSISSIDTPSSLNPLVEVEEIQGIELSPQFSNQMESLSSAIGDSVQKTNSDEAFFVDLLSYGTEPSQGLTVLAGADVHLDFDETTGNIAQDNQTQEGNQFGTLVNGASFQAESDFFGGAVVFDGVDDYVAVDDSHSINLGRHSKRSIGVWFKLNGLENGRQVIYEEGGTINGFNIYAEDNELYIGGWRVGQERWPGTYLSTANISAETWHHVALVLDTEDRSKTLQAGAFSGYLDGVLFGSGDGMELRQHGNDIGIGAVNQATRFHDGIGRKRGAYSLNGAIADFQLYNRALSASEVELLAAQEIAPSLNLSMQLVEDTSANGIPNDDGLTQNPNISGQVETELADFRLVATFAEQTSETDITEFVDAEGVFTLTERELENVFGSALIDGAYNLVLKAFDIQGNELDQQSIEFTLDQTAPSLNLSSPIVEGIHSPEGRLVGSLTDDSEIAIATYQLDGGTSETITVNADGSFNLPLSVTEGLHQLQVSVTDTAGNQATQTLDFSAAADTGVTQPNGSQGWYGTTSTSVVLGEENSLVSEAFLPVTLGQAEGSRTLSFDVQEVFDRSSDGALGDRLLVYLVDDANPDQTLLDMGVAGTPLFILGEIGAEFQPGLVRYNGNTVEIDTTAITETTDARLVFQLLNFDGDTGSVIRVDGLENTLDPEGQASPIFPMNRLVAEAGEAITLDDLNVSEDLKAVFKQVRFDADTGVVLKV